MIRKSREKLTIKKTVIPTIFLKCPSYLTDSSVMLKRLLQATKEDEMFLKVFRISRLDDSDTNLNS